MLFHAPKRKARRRPDERRKPEPVIQKGSGTEMPPQKLLVDIYFDQRGLAGQATTFYHHYEQADWQSSKGTPYRKRKLLANEWIYNYEQEQKLRRRLRENLRSSQI